MTLVAPLWTQDTKYPARLDRQLFATMPLGVSGRDQLWVTQRQQGTNFSVDVSAGNAVIPGVDDTNYLCRSTAIENRDIAAPPASGTSRIDLVYAQVTDPQAQGTTGDASWDIKVATGTAVASNPQPPALPSFAIPLARVLVKATDAAVLDAAITDQRSAGFHGGRGLLGSAILAADQTTTTSTGGVLATRAIRVGPGRRMVRIYVWGSLLRTSGAGLVKLEARISGTTLVAVQTRSEVVGGPSTQQVGAAKHFNMDGGAYTLTLWLSNPSASGVGMAQAGAWCMAEDAGPSDPFAYNL